MERTSGRFDISLDSYSKLQMQTKSNRNQQINNKIINIKHMKTFSAKMLALPLLAIGITGCISDEEVQEPKSLGNQIGFSVVSQNHTRANSYCNNLKPTKFWVTAYDGDTNYFGNNVDVVNSTDGGNTWKSDTERYWPEGKGEDWEGLTFYAYVDADNTFTLPGDGVSVPQFKNFTVKNDVATQLDLLYAVATKQHKKSATNGQVNLNFRHALSQICFTGQNKSGYDDIKINAIAVKNVIGKGTYTFPEDDTYEGRNEHTTDKSDGTTGVNTRETGWELSTIASDKADYEITGLEKDLGSNGDVVNITKATTHTKESFKNVMNLIPQESSVKFEIKIQLKASGTNTFDDETTVSMDVDVDWKEGQRYIYNLVWNGTQMTYTVNVADFEEGYPQFVEAPVCVKKLFREADEENGVSALYIADRNVGASSPSDPGLYFWWGDTEGVYYDRANNALLDKNGNVLTYNDNEVKGDYIKQYFNGYNKLIQTYSRSLSELYDDGFLTSSTTWSAGNSESAKLTKEHDAAYQNMGGDWRMMTQDDIEWLINRNNCEWSEYKVDNTIVGLKVKSKSTGQEVIFPISGHFCNGFDETTGYSWSATPEKYYNMRACNLDFDVNGGGISGINTYIHYTFRYGGMPVRGVSEKE